ncbi:peptidase M48 [Spirochaetia bacterium]|nr:peptidase M48 [Spirochaetia bacterium]
MKYLLIICAGFFLRPLFLEGQSQGGSWQGSGPSSFLNDALSDMDKAFNAIDEEATLEDEYYLGRAVAANILSAYKPYTAKPELTRYLNRICLTLAINSAQPELFNGYHVIILDTPGFNAFASPGGHIFLTRGLVEAAPSEDALAGVIAHELAHILLKHSIKIIDDMKLNEEMTAMANRAAYLAGRNSTAERVMFFRNSVSAVIDAMLKNGYTQPQEFEADNIAVSLLAASGYDPGGLMEMLRVLQQVQGSQRDGFNSTHPSPEQRIANIETASARFRVQDTRSRRTPRFTNK